MTRWRLVALGVGLTLTSASAQQAPSQPLFRSSVDLVTIDVVATSANGAPVANLQADEKAAYDKLATDLKPAG